MGGSRRGWFEKLNRVCWNLYWFPLNCTMLVDLIDPVTGKKDVPQMGHFLHVLVNEIWLRRHVAVQEEQQVACCLVHCKVLGLGYAESRQGQDVNPEADLRCRLVNVL